MPAGSGTSRPPIPTTTRPAMPRRSGTAMACTRPPFPTTGCRWACAAGSGPAGVKTGLQIDCMVCHGGSIGGQSYVGLGNTQLDLKALLFELTIADGRRPPFSTFVLNSSRGTNNAGQIAAVLLSLRNSDLSVRSFPLPLAVNLPEMDTPAVVAPEAQADDVLRRPHRRPLGPDQHAVPAGREEPRRTSRRSSRPFATSRLSSRASSRRNIRSRSTRRRPARGAGRLQADLRPVPRHLRTRTASIPTRSSRST